jgi:ectoine hydroxylase-related dioxygenase (phytanoyl-CoA dioxygenase family)
MLPLVEFDIATVQDLTAEAQRIATEVQANGAVTLRGVVPISLVHELRTALVAAMAKDAEEYGNAYPYPGMVHALMSRDSLFLNFLESPAILAISRAVLGHGCIVSAFNSSSMPPQESNYTSRIHVDSPRLVPGYITNIGFVFALDPFTKSNGAMEIAPSLVGHASCPGEEQFNAAKVILDHLTPGDAVCFNVRCWHRGGVNRTASPRHSITLNVCRAFMRQQFDYPRMLGESTVSELSPDLQQFLGYHVRMPTSMGEFLLPPNQRPYRAGQE